MLEMLGSAWNIFFIIFVFSILVFVHELGHFLAALAVGVRPERFFVGFDIFGLGIKKEFRGCVYGIGLLPLGGYVKLAGQSDDPREQATGHGKPDEIGSKPLWAQGVIITAGVVMNMIFGFLLLLYLYSTGFNETPAVVGQLTPNTPAYLAELEPGDKILSIDGHKTESLRDIMEYAVINSTGYFDIKIERDGKVFDRRVKGYSGSRGFNQIGISPPVSATVGGIDPSVPEGKQIAKLLEEGDKFVSVAGHSLSGNLADGDEMLDMLANYPGQTVSAVVHRDDTKRDVKLPVMGKGVYDIGYSVIIEISDVVDGYPAQKAGLVGGDKIKALIIDGKRHKIFSTRMLNRLIASRAYMPVNLTVSRNGKTIDSLKVQTKFMGWNMEIPAGHDTLLGITGNNGENGFTVEKVLTGSPSEGILKTGDVITAVNGKKVTDLASLMSTEACGEVELELVGSPTPLKVRPKLNPENGIALIGINMERFPKVLEVQAGTPAAKHLRPGYIVGEMYLSGDGAKTTSLRWITDTDKSGHATIETPEEIRKEILAGQQPDIDGFIPSLMLYNSVTQQKADSMGGAVSLAFYKSIDNSLMVYKTLHRLVTKQIDTSNMTGPLGIFRIMQKTTELEDPITKLIQLMALISINLAIFNLLPFPVLDGGHLTFIVAEGIKGSPPGDRFREISQYFGVVILLSLMLYVTFNDVTRWWKDHSVTSKIEKLNGLDE